MAYSVQLTVAHENWRMKKSVNGEQNLPYTSQLNHVLKGTRGRFVRPCTLQVNDVLTVSACAQHGGQFKNLVYSHPSLHKDYVAANFYGSADWA